MASAPPPPISIEEIENLSEMQLRIRVNEWFAYLALCGNEQRAGVVAQAEFYMRELERRENAAVAARDFKMAEEARKTSEVIAERDYKMAKSSGKMEKWVIFLIGLEIVIASIGLWYAIHEGNKQQIVLEEMGANTRKTAEILSRAPAITFSQNSASIHIVPQDIDEHPMEFVTPEEGLIYNGGKAALLNGNVVAFTDQQDVKISCADGKTSCKQHMEPGYVFPGVDFDFGTLAVHRGVPIKFLVMYMSNHKPFKVRLSVSGDNIEDSKVTDLTIDPTMLPPPSAKH
jgi:hypothetical protein